MNFFLVEGYKDAAIQFQKESGTDISKQDLESMEPRIQVRQLILQGKIDEAIEKVTQLDENLQENNKDIMFELKLQKLIELIKENKIQEAIEYAQKALLPMATENVQYLEQLEKVMSLLAYSEVEKAPASELVQNSQRINISSDINYELLKNTNSQEKESKLPALIKLLVWSQQRLAEKLSFPQILDVSTGKFGFVSKNQKNEKKNKL
ncbi:hypothetical protein PPERSA_09500 [Pseudocohnilembus persalinus]|uniref:CTLH domain-containing protein n=1 Tax=Pseudocohnilembus persalinus TaxID=266149 RepID=A0A0V0QFA8_PSEPJ|nr:hypothetical protein PPERSA_09500 [Pseudocohnilembus persalinus]|eukprot:KRX00894.1 hypothetical protein PPERSA_09500 [Pseudocohnilembus persalinus]